MDKYAELREAVDVCQDGQIIPHKAERFIRLASPKTIASLLAERDSLIADSARWKEVERRYDNAKTSECERVLEALWLDPKGSTKSFEIVIDAALGEKP